MNPASESAAAGDDPDLAANALTRTADASGPPDADDASPPIVDAASPLIADAASPPVVPCDGPVAPEHAPFVAAARAISARCLSTARCYRDRNGVGTGLSLDETLVLFRAAEACTGIPARLLKAIGYGEGLGDGYIVSHYPRQFYDLLDNPNFATRASWARTRLGLDVPLTLGIDTAYPTYGLGIMQLTADRSLIETAVATARAGRTPSLVQLYGGGRPYYVWPADDVVRMDVMRAIYDPFYNVVMAARLIAFKIRVYSDPRSAIRWVPAHPQTDMEWALVGSTYQVYGGIGPGGGATTRIYHRMTDATNPVYRDAWLFANAEPTLP